MHEQGLGFERDIHLAKRHYDMASAISVDGAAPVAIALVKLNFLFVLEALQKQVSFLYFCLLSCSIDNRKDILTV